MMFQSTVQPSLGRLQLDDDSGLTRRRTTSVTKFVVAAIILAVFLQAYLAVTRQVNWDEFFFLSHVYEYQRGALTTPLQTFCVHFFGWLTKLPFGEIDQIVAGRLFMLMLEIGTFSMIYNIARRFASREAALFAVLSFAACGYVLIHGAAFRADPIATFLLMSSIALLLTPVVTWPRSTIAGLAIAVAGLVTIKSAFYLPVIVFIAIGRLTEAKDRPARLLALSIGGIISLAAFALLYQLHIHSLISNDVPSQHLHAAAASSHDTVATLRHGTAVALSHDINKVFDPGTLARTWQYIGVTIVSNPITFAAIGFGIFLTVTGLRTNAENRVRPLMLLSLAFPLTTVLFYRNSFPYYYPFVLAPAAILSAIAYEKIPWAYAKLAYVGLLTTLIVPFISSLSPGQSVQRTTLNAVHAIFPKPVNYIDGWSMVSSYYQAGFFMSTWGMQSYRAGGRPMLRTAIAQRRPLFVLVDSAALKDAFSPSSFEDTQGHQLFEPDVQALHDNYIHHWGPIWVAGKTFNNVNFRSMRHFKIQIPGSYSIEATGDILIDGQVRAPGEVIELAKGEHTIQSMNAVQTVRLRWGRHLFRPAQPAPKGPIFNGF